MFTGIVTGLGEITSINPLGKKYGGDNPTAFGVRVCIKTPPNYLDDVCLGDSIAINGACMTVAVLDVPALQFFVDVSQESLQKTAGWGVNTNTNANANGRANVNLEKALRANDRLGGHLVSGHVDGIGLVTHFAQMGESWLLHIDCPEHLGQFIAYKGSIAINGVSLTINHVEDFVTAENNPTAKTIRTRLQINLIPHTVENTTLKQLQVGDDVNLEIDQIARYLERMAVFVKLSKQ